MSAGCLTAALAEQRGFGASFLATLPLLWSPRLFPFPSPRTMRCRDQAQPVRGSQAEVRLSWVSINSFCFSWLSSHMVEQGFQSTLAWSGVYSTLSSVERSEVDGKQGA